MSSSSTRQRGARAVGACLTAALVATGLTAPLAHAAPVLDPVTGSAPRAALDLRVLGSYETGAFDEAAAEIVVHHGGRLFVVNALAGLVDVLDIANPGAPMKLFSIDAGHAAQSVAVRADGLGVVITEGATKTADGYGVFFDATAASADDAVLGSVELGALPDSVAITTDGRYAVVANEGEPADDYSVDPEGSVSIITLPAALAAAAQADVRTADFHAFEAGGTKTLPAGVRIFAGIAGSDFPVSRNLEPEYVTIDGATAYVTVQEANAIAVVDLDEAEITELLPLGLKDHGRAGNGLDASDREISSSQSTISIRTYPGLKGVYMPDAIDTFSVDGATYLVTANEGDAREWGEDEPNEYLEPVRAKNLPVCDTNPALKAAAADDKRLGRLNISIASPYDEANECYTELHAFGARSFSVWDTAGNLVFDSGDQFEQIIADVAPEYFNSNHTEANFEGRSEDKGVEPEAVTIGQVGGRTYAFIGFERLGGVMVYDVTRPAAAKYVTYLNNRDFTVDQETPAAGDLGPESIAFIAADESPTGEALLAVGNEVSGTTTLIEVTPSTIDLQILSVNDFHGRLEADPGNRVAGAAVVAGAVDALSAARPNTVFVSAGDSIGGSTFTSFSQQDNPTIDALVAGGLQASVVGNHEFDRGWDDLENRVIDRYGDPRYALGANVYAKGTTTPVLDEFWVTEVDGVRVGFIGTVTQQTASMVAPDGIADIEFGDQLEAANRVAARLTDGITGNGEADVVVLLTHEGATSSRCADIPGEGSTYAELVTKASPKIDAIFSGHTHLQYACEVPVAWSGGKTRPVLQGWEYGKALARLELTVDAASKDVVSAKGSVVALHDGTTALYPADPAVTQIVADAKTAADLVGNEPIGKISATISRAFSGTSEDRGSESSLGNLIADVQLWATSNPSFAGEPAEIGIMNPGGVRADLTFAGDGTVTYKQVADVQPFGNTLVALDLTGAQLKAVLEEQWQPAGSSRPKLHLGLSKDLSYTYEVDAPRGSHVKEITFRGATVQPGDTYRVVTNSFLAAGGDNFVTFAQGTNSADTGMVDLEATVQYFEAHPVVAPAEVGRAAVYVAPPEPGDGDEDGDDDGEETGPVATTTTLALSKAKLTAGKTAVLTATVAGAKSGTVDFYRGTSKLGSATVSSSGRATLRYTPKVGTHRVTATFRGTTAAKTSSSTRVTLKVTKAASKLSSVKLSKSTLERGKTLTVTVKVSPKALARPGAVAVYYRGKKVGSAKVNAKGVAKVKVKTTKLGKKAGKRTLTVKYLGSSQVKASKARSVKLTLR